jgi:uncharacterized membrane protein YraQ (UPF0718 family)
MIDMEQNLGVIERSLRCPEKLRQQRPLGKDIAVSFVSILLPMLIVGYMSASLLQGAGQSPAVAWIISGVMVLVFSFLSFWLSRSWRARYSEMVLNIHENGLSGVCAASAFKSRDFVIPYTALQNVLANKNRLTLTAGKERVTLILDEAETLAAQLRQRIG